MDLRKFFVSFLVLNLFSFNLYASQKDQILSSMEEEAARWMGYKSSTKNSAIKPYFISYTSKYNHLDYVEVRDASVYSSYSRPSHNIYANVRVGSYEFDNVNLNKGFFEGFDSDFNPGNKAPLDISAKAIRAHLWLITDDVLKSAKYDYYQRKSRSMVEFDKGNELASFHRAEKVVSIEDYKIKKINLKRMETLLKKLSSLVPRDKNLLKHSLSFRNDQLERRFFNSEGTRIKSLKSIGSLSFSLEGRDKKGRSLTESKIIYFGNPDQIPSFKLLESEIKKLIRNFKILSEADELEAYTGPAIFLEDATGVLFHEALGHRLEGERMIAKDEGHTFKGKIGQKVAPSFVSLSDEPKLKTYEEVSLNGHYHYDSEGVEAKDIDLIKNGVLKNYLLSRIPVSKKFSQSNGHGRSSGSQLPRARMGNLHVKVSKKVAYPELEKMLIREAKKQGKKYALILSHVAGGETNTNSYGFQAFKGKPLHIVKLDIKTGKKTLHNGLEFVGTPLLTISKIIASSNRKKVFNGYCGAESGWVPVSTIAPAVLVEQIEMQLENKKAETLPIIDAP